MQKNCLECNRIFYPALKETNRGNGKVCSRQCARIRGRKVQLDRELAARIRVSCAYCDVAFTKAPSKVKKSKSGLHFCSKEHKDLAQRIGGVKEIQPPHFGKIGKNYRDVAFRVYPHQCNDCEYSRVVEILVVHHIDENRSNNALSNLVILCPNCHALRHRV